MKQLRSSKSERQAKSSNKLERGVRMNGRERESGSSITFESILPPSLLSSPSYLNSGDGGPLRRNGGRRDREG